MFFTAPLLTAFIVIDGLGKTMIALPSCVLERPMTEGAKRDKWHIQHNNICIYHTYDNGTHVQLGRHYRPGKSQHYIYSRKRVPYAPPMPIHYKSPDGMGLILTFRYDVNNANYVASGAVSITPTVTRSTGDLYRVYNEDKYDMLVNKTKWLVPSTIDVVIDGYNVANATVTEYITPPTSNTTRNTSGGATKNKTARWLPTKRKVSVKGARGKPASSKTVYRNSATGELRVRKMVARSDGSKRASYVKF
jgi:hypothetical protein